MDEKFKNFEVIDEATITNLNGETMKNIRDTLVRYYDEDVRVDPMF